MGRVVSQDELIFLVAEAKRNGKLVVFTNGCFDLLHPGHIRGFEKARAMGDLLVIGLNSNASVRQIKGAGRPILPQEERAEILAALEAVDYVCIFDEATPQQIISRVKPDVLVKGANWRPEEIIGRVEVEAAGGQVVSIPVEEGFSTTKIIETIRSLPEAAKK